MEYTGGAFKPKILWHRVIFWLIAHLAGGYGIFRYLFSAYLATYFWAVLLIILGALGFTAGVHRLWAHRAYKAVWPVRTLLLMFESLSPMCSVFEWAREHRVHHKHSETDADPHNISRGFFFSHIGWLLLERHPLTERQIQLVDVSDLKDDPIIMMQHRTFHLLWPLTTIVVPSAIPCLIWHESILHSVLLVGIVRTLIVLHVKWLVNSAAHTWGSRPYDSSIRPAENLVISLLALGEGWHNFHHVFPWDYKTSELSGNYGTNLTSAFIDLCALLGLASDLKTVSPEIIAKRKLRTGQINSTDRR